MSINPIEVMRKNHDARILFTFAFQSTLKPWPSRLSDGENGYADQELSTSSIPYRDVISSACERQSFSCLNAILQFPESLFRKPQFSESHNRLSARKPSLIPTSESPALLAYSLQLLKYPLISSLQTRQGLPCQTVHEPVRRPGEIREILTTVVPHGITLLFRT